MPVMKAFVLMPFGPDFDPVYTGLIEPALSEAGFEVSRADLSTNQQQILKDIVIALAEADLVVADVTDLNGNVMYELGLAHGMGRRTIMITRDVTSLPFDLRSYRATEYSTQFHEAGVLKERLTEIALGVVDGSAEFSNPIFDFAPGFLGRSEQVSLPPTAVTPAPVSAAGKPATSDPHPEPEAELGLLDYSIQLSESNENLTGLAERLSAATQLIGEQMTARTDQLQRTSKNLGTKAAPVLRQIMRETATEFEAYADELDAINPEMAYELGQVASSANGIARLRSGSTIDEQDQIRRDIAAYERAEKTFGEAFSNISNFARTLTDMPNMEQRLTAAVRRTSQAVNETAASIELGRSEFGRVRGLLQERLPAESAQ